MGETVSSSEWAPCHAMEDPPSMASSFPATLPLLPAQAPRTPFLSPSPPPNSTPSTSFHSLPQLLPSRHMELHTRTSRAPLFGPVSRWSVDFHHPAPKGRDIQLSPLTSTTNFSLDDVGVPWRPHSKGMREVLKKQPAAAIKMTYFSVEDGDAPSDGNKLAVITLQSAQRMNRSASVPCPGSSIRKAITRAPGRKWIYEAGIVTHEEQLKDIIKSLDDCRKTWENDGNYLQAAVVAKQVQALKIFLENKKKTKMTETHCKEKEEAEAAYKAELDEKNKLWNGRFKVFQDEVVQHAQLLKRQHETSLQNFKNKMDTRTPKKPQLSRELLNERKVQTFLGKQGKYLEAQKVKRHADRKEMKELQATLAAYQAEVALKEQALKAKQQTEMSILLQRAAQTREELKRNKEKDLACCSQRHKNVLRDLEALHKQERQKQGHRMKKIVQEFRALGGEVRDLSHTMESLVVPALSEAGGVENFATATIFEIDCLNIGGL